MKPQSTLNSKQENSLGQERVSPFCVDLSVHRWRRSTRLCFTTDGKRLGRCGQAGRDHPTSTNEGRLNEQMVNGGRRNCPSEIIYYFHLLSVAWR